MSEKRFGALSSSVNPNELAVTVQGIIKVVSGVAVALGLIAVPDGNALIDQVGVLVAAGIAAWGAVDTIFGIIRKAIVKFSER